PFFPTRTPSGYWPWRRFTIGCILFHVIRKAPCRMTFRQLSSVPFHFFWRADQQRSTRLYLLWYGGKYAKRIINPVSSANWTMRFINCVLLPEFFGPLFK